MGLNEDANLKENASRSLATSIFYLLTHDSPNGVIHMNKSVTYHVLHEGRAEYTLIKPGNPAVVETKIMGVNAAAGELRQLIVGTGIWKMSKLLDDDIQAAKNEVDKARLGCLITEVVVPGFHWDDHRFLDHDSLRLLFTDSAEGDQLIKRFSPYVQHS
ncbi:hypothetical protein FISHEDRAFT_35863 [Fistulina hepatica ATCC 64428]|uniref:DUF985 domain-containing protein n=1 Tax=Fistulina hepatica ATCC 64428 TaxID=1128425 RepID=A0A0D7AKY3_9AGAR|nr:hypothetical protein FISHEDRAFT_35863 [Fistulina hepatica ATCC 64428]